MILYVSRKTCKTLYCGWDQNLQWAESHFGSLLRLNLFLHVVFSQVSFVKEAIMKVLNLVLIFSDRWQAGAWK